MKVIVTFMLLMIPTLGYLILRSDPIIHSNNITKNETTVKQVQSFAAFIEKRPEFAVKPRAAEVVRPAPAASEALPAVSNEAKAEAKEQVAELIDIWRNQPPAYDQQWRNQVEKLFEIAEKTHSEEALDLIQGQMMVARSHSDDLNREQADKWFTRYADLEKRADKLRESADYFKEKVLDRVDQDERLIRERQSH